MNGAPSINKLTERTFPLLLWIAAATPALFGGVVLTAFLIDEDLTPAAVIFSLALTCGTTVAGGAGLLLGERPRSLFLLVLPSLAIQCVVIYNMVRIVE